MPKLKIALVGTSQLSFPGDKRERFKRSADALQITADKMDLDLYVYPDEVINEDDAIRAVKACEGHGTDFLLLQNTSFSAGRLAPVFARIRNARLGIWAIPEEAESGAVPFNSFCSMNMYKSIIGNYLREYDIPVKWFYGNTGDAVFDDRFTVTVRSLKAIKKLSAAKIALIGGIAPGFDDLYFDERKLLKRFDGMSFNRLHEFSEIKDRALSYKAQDLPGAMKILSEGSTGVHPKSYALLETNARVYLAYKDLIRENSYDALAISCWPKFQSEMRYSVCSVVAQLNDEGIIASCEGDVLSAVSMLMLSAISGEQTTLMDLSDFDASDDTVLMWHCGPASRRFMGDKAFSLGVNYHGLPHTEGEELNSCGVVRDMVFAPQHITVGRISGECDRILIAEGDFLGDVKPSFFGSRGWLGNLKLNQEEIGVMDFVNTILVRNYEHHYPIAPGDLTNELMEIAAWLKFAPVEKVCHKKYLQI